MEVTHRQALFWASQVPQGLRLSLLYLLYIEPSIQILACKQVLRFFGAYMRDLYGPMDPILLHQLYPTDLCPTLCSYLIETPTSRPLNHFHYTG